MKNHALDHLKISSFRKYILTRNLKRSWKRSWKKDWMTSMITWMTKLKWSYSLAWCWRGHFKRYYSFSQYCVLQRYSILQQVTYMCHWCVRAGFISYSTHLDISNTSTRISCTGISLSRVPMIRAHAYSCSSSLQILMSFSPHCVRCGRVLTRREKFGVSFFYISSGGKPKTSGQKVRRNRKWDLEGRLSLTAADANEAG